MGLNDRQQRFITEYLKCWNATKAAKNAGYAEDSAYSTGHRLLRNAEISAAIDARMREHAMSANEVLFHLAQIARGDMDHLTDEFGNLDKAKARELGKTNLIRKVKQRTVTGDNNDIHEAEIEAYDRLKALELIAKYHNLINTVRVDDWRSQAIADIRAGNLPYDVLAEAFDDSLAAELFAAAGIPIQISEDTT